MVNRAVQIRVKYAIDRVMAMALLLLLSPIIALIAVMIKLDSPGPVIFRQTRIGLRAKPFVISKFRTMVVGADRLLDDGGRVGETNRITRVGRVLRMFGLDELPQLLNILRGEMSIVGPRPTLPEHVARYTSQQMERFDLRPGVTGYAQISGRNELAWTKRLLYDVEYVRKYSLVWDLKILAQTVLVVVRGSGFVPDRNPEQVDDLSRAADPSSSPPMESREGGRPDYGTK